MNKLRLFREEADLTQEHMGKLLGLTKSGYALKEQGKRSFTVEEAIKAAKILKRPVEKIFA